MYPNPRRGITAKTLTSEQKKTRMHKKNTKKLNHKTKSRNYFSMKSVEIKITKNGNFLFCLTHAPCAAVKTE
jgi:hypothetical protein